MGFMSRLQSEIRHSEWKQTPELLPVIVKDMPEGRLVSHLVISQRRVALVTPSTALNDCRQFMECVREGTIAGGINDHLHSMPLIMCVAKYLCFVLYHIKRLSPLHAVDNVRCEIFVLRALSHLHISVQYILIGQGFQ
ncbi:hypothetical protein E2C01_026488 [Portunus trituberculatus]|uniref:Uncharacterized protein n=1 Tax=Portunus trituberculatus TaxID=210409 RepID=A0A5B7EIA5_PORTR|nr:hypothetical protein [Portunus trituberculatus]